METARTEPFGITRIPGSNGEWIDAHVGLNGQLCLTTSGYVEIDRSQLLAALEAVIEG